MRRGWAQGHAAAVGPWRSMRCAAPARRSAQRRAPPARPSRLTLRAGRAAPAQHHALHAVRPQPAVRGQAVVLGQAVGYEPPKRVLRLQHQLPLLPPRRLCLAGRCCCGRLLLVPAAGRGVARARGVAGGVARGVGRRGRRRAVRAVLAALCCRRGGVLRSAGQGGSVSCQPWWHKASRPLALLQAQANAAPGSTRQPLHAAPSAPPPSPPLHSSPQYPPTLAPPAATRKPSSCASSPSTSAGDARRIARRAFQLTPDLRSPPCERSERWLGARPEGCTTLPTALPSPFTPNRDSYSNVRMHAPPSRCSDAAQEETKGASQNGAARLPPKAGSWDIG